MKHQHGRESAGMIFITRFMNSFLHQASFATGYWYYDRHRSVRLVILVGLAIDQIAQSGLSSLSVIYYSAQLFSIPASNGLELSRALDDVLRKSNELRSLAGQKNNAFLPAKVGLAGDPPTEQELLSLFYQQCLKHGSWGSA
ncbi:hypothetical protein [Klebsiella michiganensis]|uniref:hypothetical protein n=1 Tax=Klebsiella michiganensis TaxID=1134687 RepID=UPI00351A19A1